VENLLVYIVNLNNETARKNHYTHQFSHIISNQLKWTPLNSSQSDTLPQFHQFLHNKPIDVRYYVLLLGTILSGNITYFCSIVAFLNEVFFLK